MQSPNLPEGIERDGQQFVSVKDGARMAFVPAGDFYMGCESDEVFAKPHEKPQRVVHTSAYLIDVFPVTNKQFEKLMADGGYERAEFWTNAGWTWKSKNKTTEPLAWGKKDWDGPTQPVAGVSWYEASAYGAWAGKRLPTEAEWEKAARGTDKRRYPWGDDFPYSKRCNFDNQVGHTTPVDAYPLGVSPFGCYDMSGNVNNWCEDWYWPQFYAYCVTNHISVNPVLDDAMMKRLGRRLLLKCDRGGGYATAKEVWEVLSCTDKVFWPPGERHLWNGFRTVIDLESRRLNVPSD